MTDTLRTFVGARLAIDKDRQQVSDATAEDDALVSLLIGSGMSDPNLDGTQPASNLEQLSTGANGQSGAKDQSAATSGTQHHAQGHHSISSHGHRAFLTDEANPAAGGHAKKDSSKQTSQ